MFLHWLLAWSMGAAASTPDGVGDGHAGTPSDVAPLPADQPLEQDAAKAAFRAVDVAACRRLAPENPVHFRVQLTFEPRGFVDDVRVLDAADGTFTPRPEGALATCIVHAFSRIHVKAHGGPPVTMGRSLVIAR